VLSYLKEIDNRKLYVEHDCATLFKFCTKILRYSDAEAALRVRAVRAIKRKPIIEQKIKDEEMNLSTAASLDTFMRDNLKVNIDKVIEKISGKSHREAKDILDRVSMKKKRRLILKLDERLIKKLQHIQRDFEDCSELEALESLMDQYLEKKKECRSKRKTRGSSQQRYISRDTKEQVNHRAQGQCEGIHNGKRCKARVNLQFEHVRPIACGGSSDLKNIRKFCFACNQRSGIKTLGIEKMTLSTGYKTREDFKIEETNAGKQFSFA